MNSQIAEAFVRIRPDMRGFKAETEAGFRSAFSEAARTATKVIGGAFAAAGFVEAIKKITEAAAAHEAAFAVLDQAIKNAGASAQGFSADLKDILEQEARLKGFSTEELASSMVRLVSVTKDTKKAFDDLRIAEDLSRARHIGLASSSLAISKAIQGSTTALQRYGIIIPKVGVAVADLKHRHDEAVAAGAKFTGSLNLQYKAALAAAAATDQAARKAEVFKVLHERFGGVASTFANTAAGQFARFGEDIHQLEIAIGTGLLPTMVGAAEGLRRLAESAAQSNIGPTIAAGFHELGQALAFIGPAAHLAGVALLDFAKVSEKVVAAVGAPALVTAFAVYKGIGVAISIATAAQKAYIAIASRAAAATGADAAAKTEEGAAAARATVSLEANTAALLANTAAAGENAAASTLNVVSGLRGASTFKTVAKEVEGVAGATAGANLGLKAFATGLTRIISPQTALIVGVAALAGGMAYLLSQETPLEKANRELKKSFEDLDTQIQQTADLQKHLADVQASAVSDKTAIKQAGLTVEQDRYALSTTKAAKGSFEYRQLVINLQRDIEGLGAAYRTLNTDEAEAAKTQRLVGEGKGKISAGFKDLAKNIASARDAAVNTGSFQFKSLLPNDGAARLRQFQASLNDFAKGLERVQGLNTPRLNEVKNVLIAYAESVGRLPNNKEIAIALSLKPNHININEFLDSVNRTANTKSVEGGHASGLAYGLAFAKGLDDSLPTVNTALSGLTRTPTGSHNTLFGSGSGFPNLLARNTGGPVPGSGTTDTVPALLTPGEVVFNEHQQRKLRKMLGLPTQSSALDLFKFVDKTAAYAVRTTRSDKGTVQKFQGGGPVFSSVSSGSTSFGALAARDRSQLEAEKQRLAAQYGHAFTKLPGWAQDQMAGKAIKDYRAPGLQSILGSTGSQGALASYRQQNLIGQGALVQPLVQPFIAGLGGNLAAKLAAGRGIGSGDILSTLGNFAGNLGMASFIKGLAGARELEPLLASRRGVSPDQLLLLDQAGAPALPGTVRGGRSGRRGPPVATELRSIMSAFAPVGSSRSDLQWALSNPSTGAGALWRGEDIEAFPHAANSILENINSVIGWPGWDFERAPIPIKMLMSDRAMGLMHPGRWRGVSPEYLSVRPDYELGIPQMALEHRLASTLTHEAGHALDYGPLKFRPNSKFPGSIASALGHRNDPQWAELWNALYNAPSTKRALSMREFVRGPARYDAQAQGLYQHLNYMTHPSELTARAFEQWITMRTQHPGLLSGLMKNFRTENVAGEGIGDWVFATKGRSPAEYDMVLRELLKGHNPSFDPIANGFERLFDARGMLRGPAQITPTNVTRVSMAGTGEGIATRAQAMRDLMSRPKSLLSPTPGIRAGRAGELFSFLDTVGPQITDPARRAEIGFPRLPEIPNDIQGGIWNAAGSILRDGKPPAGFPSTQRELAYRMAQMWQAGVLGEQGRGWYQVQGQFVPAFAKRESIDDLASAQILGITSANVNPTGNMFRASHSVRQAQNYGEVLRGVTVHQRRKVMEALGGMPWSTPAMKTSSFYPNLYTGAFGIDAAQAAKLDPFAVTNDVWVARMLNPARHGFNTPNQYQYASKVIRGLRPLLGFGLPMEAQAAPWVTFKALGLLRDEGGVYKTWEQAMAEATGGFERGFEQTMGGERTGGLLPQGSLFSRRSNFADLFTGMGRGEPGSPLSALGIPKKSLPSSVPGITLERQPIEKSPWGYHGKPHERGVPVGYQAIDDTSDRIRGNIETTWFKDQTYIDQAWIDSELRNTTLFWDLARVALDRGKPVNAEVVNTKLALVMKRLGSRGIPQLSHWMNRPGDELPGEDLTSRGFNWADMFSKPGGDDLFAKRDPKVWEEAQKYLAAHQAFADEGHDPFLAARLKASIARGERGAADVTGGQTHYTSVLVDQLKRGDWLRWPGNTFDHLEPGVNNNVVWVVMMDGTRYSETKGAAIRILRRPDPNRFGGELNYATGGFVPGSGSGDTVPAMLTPGEMILNSSQQANLASMLGVPGGRRSGRFAAGGVAGNMGFAEQFGPNSAAGVMEASIRAQFATITIKPKIKLDMASADDIRKALAKLLENVLGYSAGTTGAILAGQTKGQMLAMLASIAGPIGAATKKNVGDVVTNTIESTIKSSTAALKTYREQEAQTISGMRTDLIDSQTALSDAIKQQAIDVRAAVNAAKQNLVSLSSSVASFIDAYIDKPLQDEQQRLSAASNKLTLSRLGKSVLLPGGKTLSSDPDKAMAQLRALAKKNPAIRGAINDFLTQQYEPAALAVKQDEATKLKSRTHRTLDDLTYERNTGAISEPQFERRYREALRRAGFNKARATKLLGIAATGTAIEQENAIFAQARVSAAGPQRSGSGAVGDIVRPLEVQIRGQREIHRLTRTIGDKQIALQREIAKSTAKTAAATEKLHALQRLQGNHKGSSSDRNKGGANTQSQDHSGVGR